jgi:hypothetical protein
MLAAFGLVVVDKTIASPRVELRVWRSTDRFRAHVAASGGPLAWQTIARSRISERLFGDAQDPPDGNDEDV